VHFRCSTRLAANRLGKVSHLWRPCSQIKSAASCLVSIGRFELPLTALLRSGGHRADGRSFGAEINHPLRPQFWSAAPSKAVVSARSRVKAPEGQQRLFQGSVVLLKCFRQMPNEQIDLRDYRDRLSIDCQRMGAASVSMCPPLAAHAGAFSFGAATSIDSSVRLFQCAESSRQRDRRSPTKPEASTVPTRMGERNR
jgi:hypothetical protein